MSGQGPLNFLEGLSLIFLKGQYVNEAAYVLGFSKMTNNKGEDCISKYVPQGKSQVFNYLLQQG